MRFIDIFCILLICTVKLFGAQSYDEFHLEHTFNCTNSSSTVHIPTGYSNLRWLTLLSPCYPNEGYKGCTNQEICYIVLQDVPEHMWIGVFVEEESDTTDIFYLRSCTTTLFRSPINSLQLGLVYRDSQPLSNNRLTAALQFGGITSADPSHYRFRIALKLAYVMGRSYEGGKLAKAGSGGFIVSHETFDGRRGSNNRYPEVVDEVLTLNGLSKNNTVRLTLLSFDLHWRSYAILSYYGGCDDYLEISNIRGYPDGVKYCGYDNLTGYIDLYPVDDKITFTFKARDDWVGSSSVGFLLQYEVLQPGTNCPPGIQNTKELTEIVESSQIYTIECETNYWIQKQVYDQTVHCNTEDWQSYILPCVEIECELPEISTDSELNFTLSSRGRATVGTNISYSCNSKIDELTDGTEISTCTSNGEWNSPTPNCTLIASTTPSTTHSSAETNSNTTDARSCSTGKPSVNHTTYEMEVSDRTRSLPTYIGVGSGGLVLVVIIVVVIILLVKRNRSAKERAHSDTGTNIPMDSTNSTTHPGNDNHGDGSIYHLVDEEQTAPTRAMTRQRGTPHTEVYELAGYMEEDYENTSMMNSATQEVDDTQEYASIQAATKKKKSPPDEVNEMIDNELYGT